MPKSRIPSPARSQGIATPRRKKPRRTRSVGSPANSIASGRLTSVIEQFKEKNMESFAVSPLSSRKSVLTDNTDIEEPRRRSWWKKLGENSRDVMDVLEDNEGVANNVIEEIMDIEVLSQEKKNYTLDLPESSDGESINSIVLPQRRLFTQKENLPQKKFGQLIGKRESPSKSQKSDTTSEPTLHAGTKELFGHNRNRPIFPAGLLNISPNKTAADKTKELAAEPKAQIRNIFGNRPGNKRKNMFAEFVVSESEDEITEIQPKIFGFAKKPDQRRGSSTSRSVRGPSPSSSITTDIELDDWKHLPSSTMVEHQIEDMMTQTPVKKAKMSKLSEIKESDTGTNLSDKTSQSNRSTRSTRNKSKQLDNVEENKNITSTSNSINVSKQSGRTRKSANRSKTSPNKELESMVNKDEMVTTKDHVDNVGPVSPENAENSDDCPGSDDFHLHYEPEEKDPSKPSTNQQKHNESKILDDIVANSNDHATNDQNTVLEAIPERNTNVINQINESIKSAVLNIECTKENKEVILPNLNTSVNNMPSRKGRNMEHSNTTLEREINVDQNADNDKVIGNISNKTLNELNQSKRISDKKEIHKENDQQNESNEIGRQIEIADTANKSRNDLVEEDVENKQGNEEVALEIEQEHVKEANSNAEVEESLKTNREMDETIEDSHKETDETNEDKINKEEETDKEEESEKNVEESAEEIEQEIDNEDEVENDSEDEVVSDKEELIEESARESTNEKVAESDEEENEQVEQSDENVEKEDEKVEQNDEEIEQDDEEMEQNDEEIEQEEVEQNDEEIEQEDEEIEQEDEEVEQEDEEIEQDKEGANNTHDNDEIAADYEEVENENHSEHISNDHEDSDDNAVASDDEADQDDEVEVMEEDEEQEVTEENQNTEAQSNEEIEATPNTTHDTTGRNRKKDVTDKSPEVILHDKTNQNDSFTPRGRNTSVRHTKTLYKSLNIRPSMMPPRESTGMSDGTKNSSAEGSGWDSHRTTRKTLRQTFGKDFTMRKSLRALVMEKSAKQRQTENMELQSETVKFPQANSTELPDESDRGGMDVEESVEESDHEVSRRTRQTTLETYLQKIKQDNLEKKLKMEEEVRNSLKAPSRDVLNFFKVPAIPVRRTKLQTKSKKPLKSSIPFGDLPSEMIEDMKYKPPKRFQPTNASWITKRLYKFLETKLESKYDYKARVRAEKLVQTLYHYVKDLRRLSVASVDATENLKHEMARLDIVKTHFEFYEFFHEFMPREVRIKVVPDIVNKIALPKHGVFSDILRGNTVQG